MIDAAIRPSKMSADVVQMPGRQLNAAVLGCAPLVIAVILMCGVVLHPSVSPPFRDAAATPPWTRTGPMVKNRVDHTAILLANGTVLVAGGYDSGSANGYSLSIAEIYDPATNHWKATGSMAFAMLDQKAALLGNGMVLHVGDGSRAAQVYDPRTGRWAAIASMHVARSHCTVTALPTGEVLVAGGLESQSDQSVVLSSAELFDPHTRRWVTTGSMRTPRADHTATLLPNGTVLVVGGSAPVNIFNVLNPPPGAEIYNPRTGTWTATRSPHVLRGYHTATLLHDGTVLVAGGGNNGLLRSAEVYNPRTQSWTVTGLMRTARSGHTATLLHDGTVLVVGGSDRVASTTAEDYSPRTKLWTSVSPMLTGHFGNTATLLSNGRVLIVGGYLPSSDLAGAELYDPHANPLDGNEADRANLAQ